jgi:hypothetical protein
MEFLKNADLVKVMVKFRALSGLALLYCETIGLVRARYLIFSRSCSIRQLCVQ